VIWRTARSDKRPGAARSRLHLPKAGGQPIPDRVSIASSRRNEMAEDPAPEGRPNLAQRFSVGKTGRNDFKSRRNLCHSSLVSEKVECQACSQPRSGARIQPTAQAVGATLELSKPRRGERKAMTQTPEGRLSPHAHFSGAAKTEHALIRAPRPAASAPYCRSRISSMATLPPLSTLTTLWIALKSVSVTSTT
jgi:hypothetical protein